MTMLEIKQRIRANGESTPPEIIGPYTPFTAKAPINRRTVLQAIGAAPLAALPVAAMSASPDQTEIQRLFDVWEGHRDKYVAGLQLSTKACNEARDAGRSDYLDVESEYNQKYAYPWCDKLQDTEKLLLAIPATGFIDIALKFTVANWPEDGMEPATTAVMLDMDKVLDDWRKGVL